MEITADAFAAQCRRHSFKAKYLLVCGCGFAADLAVLKLGVMLGMEPAWARVISLICAMHVTFVLNGLIVFQGFERGARLAHQWFCYMATNAFGNLCNLLVFTTLLSLHVQVISNTVFAVATGGMVAVCINYLGTRLFVFKHSPAAVRTASPLLSGDVEP
jgi:putative flippase GtrA